MKISVDYLRKSKFFFKKCEELPNVKILRYEESVIYVNVDDFKYKVLKFSDVINKKKTKKVMAKNLNSL
jgi:hypothetical protein